MSMPSTQLVYHIWNPEAMASKLTEVFIHFRHRLCIAWDELESQITPNRSNNCPNLRYACLSIRLNTVDPGDTQVPPLKVFFENFEDADMVENRLHKSNLLQPMLVHVHYMSYCQPPGSSGYYVEENRSQITCFIKSIWPNLSYLGFDDGQCLHNYCK
ncbi:hypothetical protein ACGC1H_005273 [Rhizoctonia solani]